MLICGPKLSIFGMIISMWGIIQLGLMGVFYFNNNVAMFEDLGLKEEYPKPVEFYDVADKAYRQSAYNCWNAACIYMLVLVISVQQYYAKNHSTAK